MLAAMSWLAAWTMRKEPGIQQAAAGGILSAICAAFAGLMLFGPGPFAPSAALPPGVTLAGVDGLGLNPLLQHPAMIAHPPFLFAGYAACTIPLAMLLAALIAGRTDNEWVFRVRRWVLRAWALLTIGIFLGSWWAYTVLGWGGYWGWDAVENASLLPWLTATAAIHSLIVQQRRGMLRVSSLLLVVMTFLLCMAAAFITRSGLIDSQHAFAPSGTGWFFVGMIAAGLLLMGVVMALRWRLLCGSPPLTRVVSVEGGFIAGNALLTIMAAAVLVGTLWPLISGLFVSPPRSQGKEVYNTIVIPMAMCLTALMAFGPLLSSVSGSGFPKRRLIAGAVGAIHGLVMSLVLLKADWRVAAAAAVVGFAAFTIFDDVVRTLLRPVFKGRQGAAGVWRAFRANTRRFAGLLAHAGMAMVVIGVAGSTLAGGAKVLSLAPGQSQEAGSYTITLKSFKEVRHQHYTAIEAATSVTTKGGKAFAMSPENRIYDKDPKSAASVVALRPGLGEDLYIILDRWTDGGTKAVLKVLVYPLVTWIWVGSIIMAVAGSLCVLHRPARRDEKQRPDPGLKATAAPRPGRKGKSPAMAAEVRS
jgi:cytochrome c-type biogenesis protein CcmF